LEKVLFDTTVTRVGHEAKDMLAQSGLIVLFGLEVPEILVDIAFVHDSNALADTVSETDVLVLDGKQHPIRQVGDLACKNLAAMGHCTLHFCIDGSAELLPGSIILQTDAFPTVDLGSRIQIFRTSD